MSDMTIDSLRIEIASSSSQAEQSLNRLTDSLRNLNSACGSVSNKLSSISSSLKSFSSVGNIQSVATGITTLANSMNALNGVNTKSNGLTGFVTALTKLSGANVSDVGTQVSKLSSGLASLNGVDVKNGGVNTLVNALRRLSDSDLSSASSHLQPIITSLISLQNVDAKSSGLTGFINSITRLSNADIGRLNPQAFETIRRFVTDLSTIRVDASGLQGITPFLTAIGTFLAKSPNITQAATDLPVLTSAMQQFMSSMSNMPEASESTIRMSEALATISQNSGSVGDALRTAESGTTSYTSAIKKAHTVMEALETVFKTLIDSAKLLGKTLTTMFTSIPSLAVNAVKGVKNLVDQLKEAKNQAQGIDKLRYSLRMLLYTVAGFRGIVGIFNWAKESVVAGANITEIDHIVKSVFGDDMVDYVNEWADNAIEKFGIASGAAKQYAGVMSSMFQSSNVARSDANKMAIDLTELAGDLSAFYNIDTETAYQKIKSGMAGMVRPLRDLGIDLSVATLKEYALSQGITKSYTDMTQAEKVMLRYKYLMQATSTQQGDFGRTSLSMANQLRILKAYAASVSTQLGVGLVAALRHVIIGMNILMKYLNKAATAFANFMQKIFGKYEGGASGTALDMSGMVDDTADLASNLGDASDAMDDVDDSTKKVAADLSVLPFDELNQLAKDTETASSGTGGTGTGGLGDALDIGSLGDDEGLLAQALDNAERELSDFEKFLKQWKDKCADSFKKKDWEQLGADLAWGINKGIDTLFNAFDVAKIKKKINPWLDAFSQTFNSLIDKLHFYELGGLIGKGIDLITSSINRLIDPKTGINWDNLGRKLGEGANGLIDYINWTELGNFFANKLNLLWYIAHGFVSSFSWADFGTDLAEGANALVSKINFRMMAETVRDGLNGIITSMQNFLKDFKAYNLGAKLGNAFRTAITGINWLGLGTSLALMWNKAWSFLKAFVKSLGDKKGKGTGLGAALHDALKGAISSVKTEDMKESLKTIVKKISEDIITFFGDASLWYDIGYKIGDAIGSIFGDKETMEKAAQAINAMVKGLISFFTGAFDALKAHSTEIKESVVTFLSTLDWGSIWMVVGTIAAAKLALMIPKIAGLILVKKALEAWIIKMFGEVAASEAVVTASGGLFNGLLAVLGTATAEGTVLGGLTLAAVKLSEINDAMAGGNGKITAYGKAYDDVIQALQDTGKLSSEAREELFQLKEQYEDGTISASEFGSKLKEILDKNNVSAYQFANTLLGLKASGTVAEGAVESLFAILATSDDAYGVFINALKESGTVTDSSIERLTQLKEKLDSNEITAEQFAASFQNELKNMGVDVGTLSDLLGTIGDESLGAREKVALLALASGDVGEAISIISQSLDNTTPKVDALEPVFEKLGYTGESAFNNIKQALGEVQYATGDYSNSLIESFTEGYGTAEWTATDALNAVITKWEEMGRQPEELRSYIDYYLGKGAYDAISEATNNFSLTSATAMGSVKTDIAGIGTESETTKGKVDELTGSIGANETATETATEAMKAHNEASNAIPSLFQTMVGTVWSLFGPTLLNSFGTKADYESKGETSIDSFGSGASSKFESVQELFSGFVTSIKDTISDGFEMHSPSKFMIRCGENLITSLSNGIKNKSDALINTVTTLNLRMKTSFNSGFTTLKNQLHQHSIESANNIINGFTDTLANFNPTEKITELFSGAIDELYRVADEMYNAGQSIAQSLAEGINSVRMPNFTVDQTWSTVTYPNGGWITYLSGLTPRWYARGGLFTNATIAGLGEAGDEAAIPLENKKVMSRIANAITDNMGSGFGIDESTLISAITQGTVQALMMNQQNEKDPIFNIVVQTEDNEVLARAVQRGMRTYNYRTKY